MSQGLHWWLVHIHIAHKRDFWASVKELLEGISRTKGNWLFLGSVVSLKTDIARIPDNNRAEQMQTHIVAHRHNISKQCNISVIWLLLLICWESKPNWKSHMLNISPCHSYWHNVRHHYSPLIIGFFIDAFILVLLFWEHWTKTLFTLLLLNTFFNIEMSGTSR